MTYQELFEQRKTIGEARRLYVTLLDDAKTEIAKIEIEKAFKERKEEIRNSRRERCFA